MNVKKIKLKVKFNGSDYVSANDDQRLTNQLNRIWNLMLDGKWRTLREISRITGDPESSISAQLRHLRKELFGCHTVDKEKDTNKDGLFRYKLTPNRENIKFVS